MKKVVTIGGGTGSYTVLRGLKKFPITLTAIVSMFDSGGSSGVLRDEMGVLPPGDVRRCLLALSEGERAEIVRDLFNYRYDDTNSLCGHNFGNLLLAALSHIYGGDMKAIRKASELLDITGKVLPVSLDKAHLEVTLEDGTKINGETNVDIPKHNGNLKIIDIHLNPTAYLYKESEEAILDADLIVICPGDLFSSLVPNFLVEKMPEVISKSHAVKIGICNLMTKWGETNDQTTAEIIQTLLGYIGLDRFDYIIHSAPSKNIEMLETYAHKKQFPLIYDSTLENLATRVIRGDFSSSADLARHDSDKLAATIFGIIK